MGLTSVLAWAMTSMMFTWPRLERPAKVLVLVAYLLSEGFDVIIVNAPHGFFYTVIRIFEHVPIYVLLYHFLQTSHAISYKNNRWRG